MKQISAVTRERNRQRTRLWALDNPEKVKENNRRKMERVRDFLREYKLSRGCVDCGYKGHHVALEFDHVRGVKKRRFNGPMTFKWVWEELPKCEVRCANCHAIRHYMERHP